MSKPGMPTSIRMKKAKPSYPPTHTSLGTLVGKSHLMPPLGGHQLAGLVTWCQAQREGGVA